MATKIPKVVAGYLPQAIVPPKGTNCGTCRDFIKLTSECVILNPPKVSSERVTCILYLHGKPHEYGQPRRLIAAQDAGYIEGKDVPTKCGKCEYYENPGRIFSPCSKVGDSETDDVDAGACCNAYEGRK